MLKMRIKLWGLDAQFKQNTDQLPLYVLCTQNDKFNTIPGFIFLLSSNTVKLVTLALKKIKNYLENLGVAFKAFIMIDKCEIERQAAANIGVRTLLCEFHAIKLIMKAWKKIY